MANDEARQARRAALASIKRDFVPVLEAAGFRGKGSIFRRVVGERIDLVELQTRTSGGLLCVNLGQYPAAGIQHSWKHVPPEEVTIADVNAGPSGNALRLGESVDLDDVWFGYGPNVVASRGNVVVPPDALGAKLVATWHAQAEAAFAQGLAAVNAELREARHKARIAAQYRRS